MIGCGPGSGWFDHVVRAYQRFDERNGSFFAAGLTYYTIFALFPLLMVGFAAVGFVLSRRPELLAHDRRPRPVLGVRRPLAQQLLDLMNSAIEARASVGIIGLATAAWAGLGWISHLRAAVTEMWWDQRIDSPGFVRNKLSDLVAMLGTFAVMLATIGSARWATHAPMAAVLRWLGIPEFSVFDWLFQLVSIRDVDAGVVAAVHLDDRPAAAREGQPGRLDAGRAGWRRSASNCSSSWRRSICRVVWAARRVAAFGPVLGLMVFAYITAYLVLFCHRVGGHRVRRSARQARRASAAGDHRAAGAAGRGARARVRR